MNTRPIDIALSAVDRYIEQLEEFERGPMTYARWLHLVADSLAFRTLRKGINAHLTGLWLN